MNLKITKDMLQVNFGEIDGMYDPRLNDYFLDLDYWNRIVINNVYFVTGRKGTGKSSLYKWIEYQAVQRGAICKNILFNDFPFRKLLNLSDDGFLRPNQYQTICKYMILAQFANIICSDAGINENEYYKELEYFNRFVNPQKLENCFRNTLNRIEKTSIGFSLKGVTLKEEGENNHGFDFRNFDIYKINERLEECILAYFKLYSTDKKFIIQIDGVDENYNQITASNTNVDNYLHLVISLMKVAYTLNQKIHCSCDDIGKCIVYLRSDIFFRIHKIDAESARWEQQLEELNWAIRLKSDWINNSLRKMINMRISASIPEYEMGDAFDRLFDYKMINFYKGTYKKRVLEKNLFEYIVNRTFHRPRDVVQFCICIQREVGKSGEFTWRSIKSGEQQYSLWLLDEISNEISPEIENIDELFSLLRNIGPKPLAISRFRELYAKYEKDIDMEALTLLKYLYSVSVVFNINDKGDVYSSIRNERSKLNPDLKIAIHPGIWRGLYTSTFTD